MDPEEVCLADILSAQEVELPAWLFLGDFLQHVRDPACGPLRDEPPYLPGKHRFIYGSYHGILFSLPASNRAQCNFFTERDIKLKSGIRLPHAWMNRVK